MSLEYKNEFFKTLDTKNQKEFKILFDEDANDLDKWKECFKKFVELQKDKDVINLNFLQIHGELNREIFDELFEQSTNDNKIKVIKLENCVFYKKFDWSRTETHKIVNIPLKIYFTGSIFKDEVLFEGVNFKEIMNFDKVIFEKKVNFSSSIFHKEVTFNEANFKDESTTFANITFKEYTSFQESKFHKYVTFENTSSLQIFNFYKVSIKKIDLIGSHFQKPIFLALTDIDGYILKKDNFENKETVRILKDIFEKENNFSEANIYYPVEQEFLIDLLKDNKTSFPNKKLNLLSLYIHKYVSNFGTDWLRVLLVMIIFGFGVGIIYQILPFEHKFIGKCPNFTICNYMFFGFLIIYLLYIKYDSVKELFKKHNIPYFLLSLLIIFFSIYIFSIFISLIFDINILSYFEEQIENIRNVSNYIIQLINPLNVFSSDFFFNNKKNYFEHINYFETFALFGVIVKAITIALIYQFIIAFRNYTRRK